MSDVPLGDASDDDIAVVLRLAGLDVPADRLAGVVAGCHEIRRLAASLRVDWPADAEPADVFAVEMHAVDDTGGR